MVTAESAIADMSKDLILVATSIENDGWEESLKQWSETGGVITVNSEVSELIHVVKNRCSELWR